MKTALTALLASLATLGVVRAQPHSQSCTTSPTAQPAPTVAADQQQQLFRDLLEAPTAIKRFQRLLVKDGSLLTGDALRELTVFNFNNAQPANGAKGGSTKAAVSTRLTRKSPLTRTPSILTRSPYSPASTSASPSASSSPAASTPRTCTRAPPSS